MRPGQAGVTSHGSRDRDAVTSRVARHAAFATELGVRRRELGTAVVAEPAGAGHPAAATAASHVAAAVGRAGT